MDDDVRAVLDELDAVHARIMNLDRGSVLHQGDIIGKHYALVLEHLPTLLRLARRGLAAGEVVEAAKRMDVAAFHNTLSTRIGDSDIPFVRDGLRAALARLAAKEGA